MDQASAKLILGEGACDAQALLSACPIAATSESLRVRPCMSLPLAGSVLVLSIPEARQLLTAQPAEPFVVVLWFRQSEHADPDVLERLANALFRLKDFKEASSRYEELVKLSKKNRQMAHVHLNMGFAYGELKKYSQSAKSYEAALDQGLKDPIIHYNLAVAYEELKNEKKAMEAYERHASLQPTSEVLDKLARYYEDKGQFENAIKAYLRLEKMTTGDSGKAFYFLSMGDIAVKQGNLDKAIEYFRNSLKYNPKDGEVYFRRAEAYEKKKMYQEARQDYKIALEHGASLDQAKRKIYEMGIKITQQKFNKEQ